MRDNCMTKTLTVVNFSHKLSNLAVNHAVNKIYVLSVKPLIEMYFT